MRALHQNEFAAVSGGDYGNTAPSSSTTGNTTTLTCPDGMTNAAYVMNNTVTVSCITAVGPECTYDPTVCSQP